MNLVIKAFLRAWSRTRPARYSSSTPLTAPTLSRHSPDPFYPAVRRVYIDWLRVLAILMVFIYHSSRFWDQGDWHVKSAVTYFGVQAWTSFLGMWGMPFIFLISGASAFYAQNAGKSGGKSGGKYILARLLRLVVPLVAGIFTHIMLQVYLERTTQGGFTGSFWQFVPHYFDGLYGFGGNFAWMGLHLWYLEALFVFTLLTLPLFAWLKRRGARLLAGVNALLVRPGGIYLPALPIMILAAFLSPNHLAGARNFGGWSLVAYLLFYVYGFILVSAPTNETSISCSWPLSLAIGVLAVIGLAVAFVLAGDPRYGTLQWALVQSLLGIGAWCWIMTFWGLGAAHGTRSTPLLRYANEAVLPFYIMHQTVLLVVGYLVLPWSLPEPVKWMLIASGSFAFIIAGYEFLIRRSNILRFLFGMKPQRASTSWERSEAR